MDALCAAIPLARSLLRLAENASPTAVCLKQGSRKITLRVQAGRLHALHGLDGELLGDTLLRMGALDRHRHEAALAQGYPEREVGAWLTAVGAASEQAVRAALTRQLTLRLGALLRTRGAELVVTPARDQPEASLSVSVDLAHAVYVGLVAIARDLPRATLLAHAGAGPQRATRLGTWLEARLLRGQPELQLAPLLRSEVAPDQLPERAALRALGALLAANVEIDGYSLLLRKRRELCGQPSARRLLDLPESASPEQGRAAFRRLARKLHPDRFHAAEPALIALSNEVMRALQHAAAELSRQADCGVRVPA